MIHVIQTPPPPEDCSVVTNRSMGKVQANYRLIKTPSERHQEEVVHPGLKYGSLDPHPELGMR